MTSLFTFRNNLVNGLTIILIGDLKVPACTSAKALVISRLKRSKKGYPKAAVIKLRGKRIMTDNKLNKS